MAASEWVAPWDGGRKARWKGSCPWVGGRLGTCYPEGISEAGMPEVEVDGGEARLYQKRCGGGGSERPKDPLCGRVPKKPVVAHGPER